MIVVIFSAKIKQLDDEYYRLAAELRDRAQEFGCQHMESAFEDGTEITLSYWDNEEQIKQWKQDPQHLKAQQLALSKYYDSYIVKVADIKREYTSSV